MTDKPQQQETERQYLTFQEMKPAIIAVVERIRDSRKKAVERMPDNARLRRTPFDALDDQDLLTPEGLTLQWDAIRRKQSRLPSSQRKVVVSIINDAMTRVLVQQEREKREKIAKEKAKANETGKAK